MAVQAGLCRTWSEAPKTGFLRTRLIFSMLEFREFQSGNVSLTSHELKHDKTTLYINMPMHYTATFTTVKMTSCDIFQIIFAQNIDCGYSLDPPH